MVFSCSAGANFRWRAPDSYCSSFSLPWKAEVARSVWCNAFPQKLHSLTIKSSLFGWRRCWWAKQGVTPSREKSVLSEVTVRWESWWGYHWVFSSPQLIGLQSQVGKKPVGNCLSSLSCANWMHYAMLGPIFPSWQIFSFFKEKNSFLFSWISSF